MNTTHEMRNAMVVGCDYILRAVPYVLRVTKSRATMEISYCLCCNCFQCF